MQGKKEKKLDSKKRLFCSYYLSLRQPEKAAIKAGYPAASAERVAQRLLESAPVIRQLAQMREEKREENVAQMVRAGLERLAFGSVEDAIRLAIQPEEAGAMLDRLDLFNISDIRFQKNGQCEIHFFDRQRALEKLLDYYGREEDRKEQSFYAALKESADAVKGDMSDERI